MIKAELSVCHALSDRTHFGESGFPKKKDTFCVHMKIFVGDVFQYVRVNK